MLYDVNDALSFPAALSNRLNQSQMFTSRKYANVSVRTICFFTKACGLSMKSEKVFLHPCAVRLNPIPGNQAGRYCTA